MRSDNKDDAGNTAAVVSKTILAYLSGFDMVLDAKQDDRRHRHLTLRIPYCDLCRKPYFCLRDNDDETFLHGDYGDSQKPTIEGIEFEFSSILWTWTQLALLWKIDGHDGIETNILTGFVHRPCNTCINRETILRGRMVLYIQQCDGSEAWAVWMWLMMRGSGQVNFWWHELRNTGLPDSSPPNAMEFRALMAAGWKARTGVAWEDMYDVELGEHPLLFTPHSEVFTSLSQWNALARIYRQPDPVPMLPPRLLDISDVMLEYEPAVERPRRYRTPQHGHHPEHATSGAVNNNRPTLPVSTPPRPAQPVSALHRPGAKINLRSDDEHNDRPAKRLRFADEVDVLGENYQLPAHVSAQPETSSPADSDHTLVDSDDSNEDLTNDTIAVLVPCQFGFYHVRYMDPNCAWQLPLGVDIEEGTPIEPPRRQQPNVAEEAQDKGKGPEIAETKAEVEVKGKAPELSEAEGKEKGKEPVAAGIEYDGRNKNQQGRVGTGRSKRDALVLSSDESSTYSDSD